MTYFVIGVGGALAAVFAVFSQVHAADPSTPSPAPPTAKNERQPHYESAYERRVFHSPHGDDFAYGWLPPLHPEPGRKYPLVICLHGSGGSVKASSVLAREKMRADYPTFVMVGEAEAPFDWAATGVFAEKKRPEKLPVLLETVHALLTTEAIDPARIYITGQSLGGIGSWGAIARDPALFAAAVPVCGAWSVDDAPKMAAVPVWAFHGADDRTVPVHFSRDLTAAITKAGGAAKYTEYPGVGHNSWLRAYEEPEMWAWLFAQHKTAPKN